VSEESQSTGVSTSSISQRLGFWLGLVLFFVLWLFVELDPEKPEVSAMAAVAVLMAAWWVTEAIPMAVTGLLPLVLFPMLGIMKGTETASIYTDSVIILFIGGFFIAMAMERWNLHARIALNIIRIVGGQPRRLALGFMLATGILSMGMSNTATAMMMTPMGMSIVLLYEGIMGEDAMRAPAGRHHARNFSVVILLSIAYAASIGGVATLVGTPTNLMFTGVFDRSFPTAEKISFFQWGLFALPLSVTMMLLAWLVLCRVVYPIPAEGPFSGEKFIREQIEKLGRIKREESIVLIVFIITGLLWITRSDITISETLSIPGWGDFFSFNVLDEFGKPMLDDKGEIKRISYVDDGTVAIFMGVLLFLLPSRRSPSGRVMDWSVAKKMPWGILLLFGGGFALAKGLSDSGLSDWIGRRFEMLEGAPPLVLILVVSLVVLVVTELASNMATVQMALPVLVSLSRSIEVNPLLLMIPATIMASMGFMMPMGTTPNMIAYGTEKITVRDMMRGGFYLNLLAVFLTTIYILTLALPIFGIKAGVFPEWAATPKP